MDQLVVLQQIHESFFKGGDCLKKIDSEAIDGCCPELVGELLDDSKKGRINESVCRELSENLQDVYELKRLGDICRKAGQPAIATDAYKKALSICDDSVLRPVLQNNLGQAHVIQSDLAKAEFHFKQAAEIFKKEGDRSGLAHVLGNLGSAYRQNGLWNSAIEHCYQSLKTFEEDGDDLGVAQMTGSIGRIYADMGENDLASRYFEKSLSDFQRLGDKKSAAWVLDRLGRIARDRKEWDEALSYFQSSVSIFEEMDECSSLGVALSNLGRTFLQMNEPFAAREPLERSVLLISKQAQPDFQNSIYNLARTYGYLARDCLEQAEAREENRDGSGEPQRKEASRLFALVADRCQDLAGSLGDGKDEIQMQAHLAKGQSYLCQISDQTADAASFALADKALASIESAGASAKDNKKAMIFRLERAVSAMKEIYGQQSLSEDGKQNCRALTNSTEYLLGASNGLEPEEASESLSRALKSINAGIEAEGSGKDSAERLQSAASELDSLKEYFSFSGTEKASRSAKLIEKAADALKKSASKSGEEDQEDGPKKSDKLVDYMDEKVAILAIAGAIAAHSLENIEKASEALEWDEDLHLSSQKESIEKADLTPQDNSDEEVSVNAKPEADALKDDASYETMPEDDLPEKAGADEVTLEMLTSEVQNSEEMDSGDMASDEIASNEIAPGEEISNKKAFEEDIRVKELILADGRHAGIRISSADTEDPDEGFIVTVKSDTASNQSPGQLLLSDDGRSSEEQLHEDIHLFPGMDQAKSVAQERDIQHIGAGSEEIDRVHTEAPNNRESAHEDREQASDSGVEDFGRLFKESPSSPEFEKESLTSLVHPKALFLLKVLSLLVALLLAIEAIIYLI